MPVCLNQVGSTEFCQTFFLHYGNNFMVLPRPVNNVFVDAFPTIGSNMHSWRTSRLRLPIVGRSALFFGILYQYSYVMDVIPIFQCCQ